MRTQLRLMSSGPLVPDPKCPTCNSYKFLFLVTQKQHKLHREDTQSILTTKLSEKKPEALIDIMQATDSRRKSRIDVKSESKVEPRISKLKFVSGPVCIRTKMEFTYCNEH